MAQVQLLRSNRAAAPLMEEVQEEVGKVRMFVWLDEPSLSFTSPAVLIPRCASLGPLSHRVLLQFPLLPCWAGHSLNAAVVPSRDPHSLILKYLQSNMLCNYCIIS